MCGVNLDRFDVIKFIEGQFSVNAIVNDKKEKLEIYYQLTYDSQGSILNLLNATTIGKGQQTGKLHIQI